MDHYGGERPGMAPKIYLGRPQFIWRPVKYLIQWPIISLEKVAAYGVPGFRRLANFFEPVEPSIAVGVFSEIIGHMDRFYLHIPTYSFVVVKKLYVRCVFLVLLE